jgi:hypothetical protein
MGRAFRVLKRTAHLTVEVAERPARVVAAPEAGTPAKRAARPKAKAQKTTTARRAPAAKSKKAEAKE